MAADLLDETHDCGANALQGAEYTSDGTPCVLQMEANCAGDAVGGTRTSEKISTFLRDTSAGPSTTTKRLSWTPLDDIIRGSAALDALDSKLLRLQKNHAYRPIARKCAGCATAPVGDTSISPVLGDDAGLYTPFEPSDSTPTQKIEQIYQIPHSPSEPTTSNDRLLTKAPKTTNAPEHGTVNATEPSKATACKGAPGDPTKSGSICQSINFLPSETIFFAPQQGAKSSVSTSQTKECPTQPLDAHGFPDICASTSTAGQAIGNDGAGGFSGGSDTPCATPIVHFVSSEPDSRVCATPRQATDDVSYGCLPTDQDILDEDPTVSYPTKLGHADVVEISAKDRFLDGAASRDAPTPEEILHPNSPAISDATTLVDTPDFGKSLSRSNSTEIHCVDPQIHDNGVSETSVVVCATPGRESVATAADLPEELFDHIIRGIIEITVCGGLEFTESNRYVGACALTCRYWAKKLRSWNFGDMRIFSERQIRNLEALLRAPPVPHMEPVAALIRHLKIIHDGSDAPWLHRVTHLIAQYPALAQDIRLDLELAHYGLAARSQPFRSIFFYLPRTTPFLYHKFFKLVLKNTRFAAPQDLFALLVEFRNLRFLHLNNVTWSLPSPLQFPPPPIPESLHGIYVEHPRDPGGEHGGDGIVPWMISAAMALTPVHYLSQQALGTWPYITPKCANHMRSRLLPMISSEVRQIVDVIEAFYPNGLSSSQPPDETIFWKIHRCHPNDEAGDMGFEVRAMVRTDSFPLAVSPAITFQLRSEAPPPHLRPYGTRYKPMNLRVHEMYLNFTLLQSQSTQALLGDMDWVKFFRSTLALEQLEDVKIHVKSEEEREKLVGFHAELLEQILPENPKRMSCRYLYQLRWRPADSSSSEDYIIST